MGYPQNHATLDSWDPFSIEPTMALPWDPRKSRIGWWRFFAHGMPPMDQHPIPRGRRRWCKIQWGPRMEATPPVPCSWSDSLVQLQVGEKMAHVAPAGHLLSPLKFAVSSPVTHKQVNTKNKASGFFLAAHGRLVMARAGKIDILHVLLEKKTKTRLATKKTWKKSRILQNHEVVTFTSIACH